MSRKSSPNHLKSELKIMSFLVTENSKSVAFKFNAFCARSSFRSQFTDPFILGKSDRCLGKGLKVKKIDLKKKNKKLQKYLFLNIIGKKKNISKFHQNLYVI